MNTGTIEIITYLSPRRVNLKDDAAGIIFIVFSLFSTDCEHIDYRMHNILIGGHMSAVN